MEQVNPTMQRLQEEPLGMDYGSYDDRYEEVKMSVSSPFTRYITLSNNVKDSMSHSYPYVPVLMYSPRTCSDVIVTR